MRKFKSEECLQKCKIQQKYKKEERKICFKFDRSMIYHKNQILNLIEGILNKFCVISKIYSTVQFTKSVKTEGGRYWTLYTVNYTLTEIAVNHKIYRKGNYRINTD